jgi:vesicle coat complex subunit
MYRGHGRIEALLISQAPFCYKQVVANAIASISEIMEKSDRDVNFNMNMPIVNKLLTALNECNEWGQAYILESLMNFIPVDPSDAETVCERVAPRMQHANSAVILTAIKVRTSFLESLALGARIRRSVRV